MLNEILEKVGKLKVESSQALSNANSLETIENLRVQYLGKKGELTAILSSMRDLEHEDKKTVGAKVNEVKQFLEETITNKKEELMKKELEDKILNAEKYDISIPVDIELGSLHPITIVQKELEEIFKSMGFIVEDGNEVETEYNNFESLNIPSYHPARDTQDTFWLDNGQLLKTHTSASQNRIMKKYGAPLKVVFPGRCFRNETVDASHDTTFFQMEGMMIDKDVSIANLIYFMRQMLQEVFKKDLKVRLRPGYFPFVEPGFELDISCPYCTGTGCSSCKKTGWIELCPCGLIHPNVLKDGGIDLEKYSGFAFGLGLRKAGYDEI